MIVSEKYKYVFVEQPLTASTAIASELTEYYGGREVLSKHSNYSDFLRVATDEQRKYKVVIGVRNPLDQIVSVYQKLKTNHGNAYNNPRIYEENGGWVSKRQRNMFQYIHAEKHGFSDYFLHFFGRPRIKMNQYLWCPTRYDFVIRFERLQSDFAEFLRLVGAEKVRDLPVVNKTAGKRDYFSYFTPDTHKTVMYVFGPVMSAWGYEAPHDWQTRNVPGAATFQFRAMNLAARFCIQILGMTPEKYRTLRATIGRRSAAK